MRKFGIAFAFVAMAMIIPQSCGFINTSVTTNATTDLVWTAQAICPTSLQAPVPDRTERDVGTLTTLAGTKTGKIGYYFDSKKDLTGAIFRSANHETMTRDHDSIIRTVTERRTTAVTPATATETSNGDRFAVACIQRRYGGSSSYM